ncbi:L,D-transpeptidase family protein [Jannaschia sp. LMIT008]|uniref:L,D-transpeptidase family protein n=1 Tax=Jannaschia maritima TaxID=3032585 RepID=UPI0028118619|nr:L,D-transpeptidase family protein [Jannaschia sp. LMIT008]
MIKSLALTAVLLIASLPGSATANTEFTFTPRQHAVAIASADDPAMAAFYRDRDFAPLWFGPGAGERRAAFLSVLERAGDHGLPADRYDAAALRAAFRDVRSGTDLGRLDVRLTGSLLQYARDVGSGVLDPKRVDPTIVVEVPTRDLTSDLHAFATGDPHAVLRSFQPATRAYTALLREKMRLDGVARAGGWGPPVPAGKLRPGDTGGAVVALRDRLHAMGYLGRTITAEYDTAMERAVERFQADHGLTADGIAGQGTIDAINVPLEDRLAQVILNLERQRWMNKPLERRHVLVNIAEQHAYVVDDGIVTFDTVVVVGKESADRRTPEFSDTMTHMVVNPSWYVPRSIATKEYLPALKRGGARHLEVYSSKGRVNRGAVNFAAYTARTFPFSLRQPPGPKNALGQVKFMFPNKYNIYLHDTPSKSLFARDVRTFSHGCVRVARPAELAAHLLAPQEADPRNAFDRIRATGAERRVDLDTPVGVHLVYWSAWVTPDGRANYRGDPYGRDRAVMSALRAAGVDLTPGRS